MTDTETFTYQTRPTLKKAPQDILSECAALFNTVEHTLYGEMAKGNRAASCKNSFLTKYRITARQFNACRVSVEGKVAACKASQEQAVFTLNQQIERLTGQIQRLEKKPSKFFVIHQKKRKKQTLLNRLSSLEDDIKAGRVRLCFGGKKLFRAQFHLKENGFSSPQEWKGEWNSKRNSEFFILGSKDETSGNQTCSAKIQANGKFTLRLRLPDSLAEKHGKYLIIENVSFAYGHQAILTALNNPNGQALSYRFKKDKKGWRVFVSTDLKKN